MSVKLGLISDVHSTPGPVQEALSIFAREGVEHIICAGDIAGYGDALEATLRLLTESSCLSILGNHDLWWLEANDAFAGDWVHSCLQKMPVTIELELEGKRLYVVHASPPVSQMDGIKLLDENGELLSAERHYWQTKLEPCNYDVLIVGHTHQLFAEQLGSTLVINPGSTQFNHSCMILSLPEMHVEVFALSGKEPLRSWNWGMFQQGGYSNL